MQQVLALRAIARPVQGLSFSAQWGISQQQGNRYSTTGLDPSQKLQTGLQWDLEIVEEVQMRSWADLELRSADFVVFDPVRDVEFEPKVGYRGCKPVRRDAAAGRARSSTWQQYGCTMALPAPEQGCAKRTSQFEYSCKISCCLIAGDSPWQMQVS